MAKVKFPKEYFEKPEDPGGLDKKSRWWRKPLAIVAAVILLCGAGYGIYLLSNIESKEPEKEDSISQESKMSEEAPIAKDVSDDRDSSKIIQEQTTEDTVNKSGENASANVQQAETTTAGNNPPGESLQSPVLNGSVEQKAKHVIRGDFGNGQARKDKLGSEYETIQSKVNEMYRKGDLFM